METEATMEEEEKTEVVENGLDVMNKFLKNKNGTLGEDELDDENEMDSDEQEAQAALEEIVDDTVAEEINAKCRF